ncbi:UDPglucose 6-dehydrogenase [Halopseudomonas sabulinigri]|uniref:UDP-glucose 6-dehydrogenase n=1 Tax=Halopseudomonas sabulinigri TaxID=472181 RepID=A0A1H1MGH1_9GAMM|nr:UDP-glucose/GDP-mannose dehydrogenase family protein [Halopseudomonas sabulinigri]SDR85796.1 UDPglucose 6-dehydrogenase [Halopseudomonas sabulinigri]
MQICVIGCGYVGLVTAVCFAEMGNSVTCVDSNGERIAALEKGISPIFEPGIEALLHSNIAGGRLTFSSSLAAAAPDAEIVFIAVGTPSASDGAADVSQILAVAQALSEHLSKPAIVVCKSTAPVGTACRVQAILDRTPAGLQHRVVSNPEFLKEGDALNDFMRPDRIIIGTDDRHSQRVMHQLYEPFVRNHDRIMFMSRRAAEMTKYAANAFLATKISFINEMAAFCDEFAVDVEQVRKGIGADQRIGHHFIYAGCGYGGSCFPKDIRAMLHMAETQGTRMPILEAVEARNQLQKEWLFRCLQRSLGQDLRGVTVAIWGLAFKPGTDDIRDAPSRVLIESLLATGARIQAFDPIAADNIARCYARAVAEGQLALGDAPYAVLNNADALVLVTEWKQFRQPDFALMRTLMRRPLLLDGRNQYDPQQVERAGFAYHGVGRPASRPQLPALRRAG